MSADPSDLAQTPLQQSHWRRYRALYQLAALFLTPVVIAYLLYYVFQPDGRTNYGDLVQPQRPLPALTLTQPDESSFDIGSLRGKWLMVTVNDAVCQEACQKKLWNVRQVWQTTGRDRDRVERVVLLIDPAPIPPAVLHEHQGALFLRARNAELLGYLELPQIRDPRLTDYIWLIDPLGNQMLRWPKNADPNRMKKDLHKLLRASRIG